MSETWLTEKDSDPDVSGFTMYRCDRSASITGKSQGGGVCAYVNNKWCTNVKVKEQFCTADVELLCLALRPFYLPREFNQMFIAVVYVHPSADVKAAAARISAVIHHLSSLSPDSPSFILGDFNMCRLNKALPIFKQYVTCQTHMHNTIDLCYGNIPKAFTARPLPGLGLCKHKMIQLVPLYRQRLKRFKPVKREARVWSKESTESLIGCFECTDWQVFLDDGMSLDETTEVVSDYISFCTDTIIGKKIIKIYPNNKPWITPDLKDAMNQKRMAFKTGDTDYIRSAQRDLEKKIKVAKRAYSRRLEEKFRANNAKLYWKDIQTITGHQKQPSPIHAENDADLASELNTFYTRFDKHNFRLQQEEVLKTVHRRSFERVVISVEEVRTHFKRVKARGASGPDKISSKVLKECADSLAPVFTQLFQKSLDGGSIPSIWKQSLIVPMAKKRSPKEFNDYRPVALTSVAFKCAEKIVLQRLRKETADHQDPLQFAYCSGRSAEDAILTLLHNLLQHLDRPRTYARILFVDFSSAFNTIQPHLLLEKLLNMQVNPTLLHWIFSFLTNRTQQVRVGNAVSPVLTTNTGAPQGCVLSPALFTLYTADCRCKDGKNLLIKFADDTSLSGLLQEDDTAYKDAVASLVSWCDRNFLELNVSKTKEIIVDYRKKKTATELLIIKGETVELVKSYKYLGTMIDNKLDWSTNVDYCVKKTNQRLHCLKKLKSFKVHEDILLLFYQSAVQSVMLYNHICFYGNIKKTDEMRLEAIVRAAQKIIPHHELKPLTHIFESAVVKKLNKIMTDVSHPLRPFLSGCISERDSSTRLLSFKSRTDRFKKSFLPTAVRVFNQRVA